MITATLQSSGVELTQERVAKWCDAVLDGTIPACKWTKLAVERHYRDMETGHERGLWHDPDTVQIWVEFFRCLQHFEGDFAGQPIDLDPWELFVVWNVFGWMRADGTRRFRRAYIEIARKVGKSTFAAGIGLGLLMIDGEPGPQVYSAALDKQHARRVLHSKAEKYVKRSPYLRKRLDISKTTGRITFEQNDGFYEPLGKDSDVGEGFNPHGCIYDELHAHKTREMWDVIDSGQGARSQPLVFAITTAGFDTSSFCYTEIRDQVCQILQQVYDDDEWFGCIWSIDDEECTEKCPKNCQTHIKDQWQDEACWPKANPQSYFHTQIDDMRRMAREASRKPGALNNFLTKRLDVWTEQTVKWVNLADWKKSPDIIPEAELVGKACYSALDLSANTDLTAMLHLFPYGDDELTIIPRFWIPKDRIKDREHRDAAQYENWVRQGLVTATEGNVIDYKRVKFDIEADLAGFDVQNLAYDPWGPAEAIRQQLLDDGMDNDMMIAFRQGYASMSPAMKTLERLYLEGKIRGLNHPVMLWMASNVQARIDPAGNVKPDKSVNKKKTSRETSKRIDGFVCLVMCVGLWSVAKPTPKDPEIHLI